MDWINTVLLMSISHIFRVVTRWPLKFLIQYHSSGSWNFAESVHTNRMHCCCTFSFKIVKSWSVSVSHNVRLYNSSVLLKHMGENNMVHHFRNTGTTAYWVFPGKCHHPNSIFSEQAHASDWRVSSVALASSYWGIARMAMLSVANST